MPKIKKLHAYIGGFPGSHYSIDLIDENTIRYQSMLHGEEIIRITTSDLTEFLDKLTRISIKTWDTDYNDPETMDGTQWKIEIETSEFHVISGGSNKYPPEAEFDHVISAIRELIKREFR